MKKLAIFFFFLSASVSLAAKEIIHRDQNGMPRCIESDSSILVVWDPLIQNSSRPVYGITLQKYTEKNAHQLRSCRDWPAAVDWPEGLTPISEYSSDFSDSLQFALRQIADGAKTFHEEKTGAQYLSRHQSDFQMGTPVHFGEFEKNYGSTFTNEIAQAWIAQLVKTEQMNPKKCSQLIGTCEYYLCLESTHQCGVNGYPVGFGYKYCNGSLNGLYQDMKSDLGKQWVVSTVQCLQKKMDSELKQQKLSCDQIRKEALDSHPDCYVQSGFCELPFRDQFQIFKLVKSELFKAGTFSQAKETLQLCGKNSE